MKLFRWLWVRLGQARHDYKLIAHSDLHVCSKCGNTLRIPIGSEFMYRLREFKGCKKY